MELPSNFSKAKLEFGISLDKRYIRNGECLSSFNFSNFANDP